MEGQEQTTLHDTLTASFDQVIPDAANPPASTPESVPIPGTQPAAAPSAAEDAPKAEERARGPDGKFIEKPVKAEGNKGFVSSKPAAPVTPPPVAEPKKINRPSSWKKDHWEAFDKLAAENPVVAEYILQRETEAARGVSAYKAEWDRAKPILDAVTPYLPMYQQHGIDPGRQFALYAEIHKGLALGDENQKLGTLLRLAQDYKIPVEKLFVQQDGKVFYNPQVQPTAPQPQAAVTPQAIEQTVQAVLMRERTALSIADMEKNTEKYPHFAAVRNTMGQLIDAGIASPDDLPGAYDAALALPQHRELYALQQQQQQATDEAARKAKQVADAQRARAAAVSPKSATPASAPAQARKGLRDTLVEQFDARESSRV